MRFPAKVLFKPPCQIRAALMSGFWSSTGLCLRSLPISQSENRQPEIDQGDLDGHELSQKQIVG
ncbi:hypothetical protein [Planctopirus limnophila]|uniref:hypothetical protein n=1 Tax=Planctopirus limnophila TaxID=120 RepID=UPI0001A2F9A3|nr:hypothetical protein [Planctopirus limnophila]